MDHEFAHALSVARNKLQARQPRSARPMSALAAAAFFALSALTFATVAVLAPANEKMPAARTGVQ